MDNFLIVGIGASAGGILALKEFFINVPADSGVAYVVILHLSPDHDSQLAEVLQQAACIPVTQVQEKVHIVPDHIYVIPPNQHLVIEDSCIIPSMNLYTEERRAPVDIFFRTLADTHGQRAVCVVLSGTGANGSMGLKRIKENGGAAFVQNPREAQFNEMPRNSIATDLVDEVLPVADIPAKIIAYKKSIGTVSISIKADTRSELEQQAFREIFSQLRSRTGQDFSNYKRPTLHRRIERRISVHNLPDLPAYAEFIRDKPEETLALMKDLLISVTNFFRDTKAWQVIERDVIPRILRENHPDEQIRIWVAGCATGEEAYSFAMLFAEQSLPGTPKVQIFATDIDEAAIMKARDGYYTLNDAADVSPERLSNFFTKENDGYRVRREIRECILFAHHNFIKDPPFSRLHFISCRNVLIYMNHTAQERALETFHFALIPRGYLMLGTSETTDGCSDLFPPVNAELHIYQSRQASGRIAYPVLESPAAARFLSTRQFQAIIPQPAGGQERNQPQRISFGEMHQQMLEQYAPPSLVVNENFDLVHVSPNAGRYLQVAGGEPSKNLLKLIRPELKLKVRTALYQAVKNKTNVDASHLQVTIDAQPETVTVKVHPVLNEEDTARGFILVLFEPSQASPGISEQITATDESISSHLEHELERVKQDLTVSLEQYEIQTEELRASNEELQAMNEELRSAAEELETSREELQSINEELMAVNQELKVKIEELSQSNTNFQNLMNSTDIGTIFLDRALRIKMFTPTVKLIFNLIEADLNRPLTDITSRLDMTGLFKEVAGVQKTLHTTEREIQAGNNWFLMRIFPYRSVENRIDGVVITFFDITRRKFSESELAKTASRLEQQTRIFNTTLSSITDFAYIFDRNGHFLFANQPLLELLGVTLQEITGKTFHQLPYPKELANRLHQQIKDVVKTKQIVRDETPFINPEGKDGYYEYIFSPIIGNDGSVEVVAGSTRDTTERKNTELKLRESEERFRTLTDAVPQVIWANDGKGKANYFNQRWYDYSGLSYDESFGKGWEAIVHPDDAPASKAKWQQSLATAEIFDAEYRLRRHDGEYRWHIGRNVPLKDSDGNILGWFGSATDIEDIKQVEEALRNTSERLQLALETGMLGSYECDFVTGEIYATAQHKANYGFGEHEQYTFEELKQRIDAGDREKMEHELARAIKEHTIYAAEYRVVWDDTLRWIKSIGRIIYNEQDEAIKMVGITLDITEQKLFTEELSKQVKERTIELKRSNDDLQQFAHVTSHDLKEPIRKIKTFNSRLMQEFGMLLPAKGQSYLDKIKISAERMFSMIDGVLNYSKLDNTEQPVEPIDLNNTLQQIETDLEVLIQKKKAVITKNNLPVINANGVLIYQLFYNLVLNSLKFAKAGEPSQISIVSEELKQDDRLFYKITLSDNGIGFDPIYEHSIFETFSRLNSSDEYEGTGLGLALCKKIAERHGGSILAKGKINNGASFIIYLPY